MLLAAVVSSFPKRASFDVSMIVKIKFGTDIMEIECRHLLGKVFDERDILKHCLMQEESSNCSRDGLTSINLF